MQKNESPKPYLFTDNNPFQVEDYARSISRLKKPDRPVDVVFDSDTYNEVDDQFALAYLISSSDKLTVKGIYAAPFSNHHASNPKEGMEKSYLEAIKVLQMIGASEYESMVYKGSDRYLENETTWVESDAVDHLIELAEQYSEENPLYVIGIAACTNIASALLKKPSIKDKIFVVWLGGLGFDWHDNRSFNAGQDVASARVLLGSGVPLVLIPGRGVVDHFTTTEPELEYWLRGKNAFCDYMIDKTINEARICNNEKMWSRPISDVVAVAWLLDGNFMLDRIINSPVMEYDHLYSVDQRRLFVRYVYSVNRDSLMNDLFTKLSAIPSDIPLP